MFFNRNNISRLKRRDYLKIMTISLIGTLYAIYKFNLDIVLSHLILVCPKHPALDWSWAYIHQAPKNSHWCHREILGLRTGSNSLADPAAQLLAISGHITTWPFRANTKMTITVVPA